MDPALHHKIYREGVDEQAILRYLKYTNFYHLYYSVTDHI